MATSTATTETVPKQWPGAFGLYKYSRNAVMNNNWTFLYLILATFVVQILFNNQSQPAFLQIIGSLINVGIEIVIIMVLLAGVRGKKVSFDGLMDKLPMLALKYIVQSFVVVLLLILSIVALVVPFFFVFPRLMLAPYYLIDKDLGPIEAIKASWNDSQNHVGKIYGMIGAGLVMALSCLVLVGFYFLFMYAAALAVLYVFINKK